MQVQCFASSTSHGRVYEYPKQSYHQNQRKQLENQENESSRNSSSKTNRADTIPTISITFMANQPLSHTAIYNNTHAHIIYINTHIVLPVNTCPIHFCFSFYFKFFVAVAFLRSTFDFDRGRDRVQMHRFDLQSFYFRWSSKEFGSLPFRES